MSDGKTNNDTWDKESIIGSESRNPLPRKVAARPVPPPPPPKKESKQG